MRTALALSYALITILTSKVTAESSFWLEDIKHQGVAAFSSNSSYQVFRNVKDFGAKGFNENPLTWGDLLRKCR